MQTGAGAGNLIKVWYPVAVSHPSTGDLSKGRTLIFQGRFCNYVGIRSTCGSCILVEVTATLPAKSHRQYNQVKLSIRLCEQNEGRGHWQFPLKHSMRRATKLIEHTRQQKRLAPRARRPKSDDSIDFVRCRICGDCLRVISGRHLSKHDSDRETYMGEYGLSPDELIAKDSRRLHSSRRDYRPYTKRDWIAAIKKVYKRDGQVFAGFLQEKYQQLYHQGTWLFGDWNNALRAAGFNPEKTRIRGLWDSEKVVKKIRRMRTQNLPLYAAYVMKHQQDLFGGALRLYGSWNKALVAAGVPKKEIPRNLGQNRFVVLRALRDALKMHSTDDIPEALKFRAAHYFGSLRKAVAA